VSVLGRCDCLLCGTIMCLYSVVVIVSAVWYNHVSVLSSCDCLRCVVQSCVCTR
jgi:hypothetical protein